MSGNNRVPSGQHRFENLDCPVEVGEECVMPQRRAWGWDRSINPVYVGFLITALLAVLAWAGGPGGVNSHFSTLDAAAIQQARDIEATKKQMDQLRQETREDLKEIKENLNRLIERRH